MTVFESSDWIGGHTHTVDVQVDSSASGTSGLDYKIWTVETTNRADICPENGAQSSATRPSSGSTSD